MGKRMGKKAQQLSITAMVLLVIGVVILVVIVLGFTQGFDTIFGKFNFLPGSDLQTVIKFCEITADSDLVVDYCSEFKKIKVDDVNKYVNCAWVLQENQNNAEKTIDCAGKGYANPEKKRCETLNEDVIVNQQSCKDWGVFKGQTTP